MKKLIFPIIVILFAIIISILFLIFTTEKSFFISNDDKNPTSDNANEIGSSLDNNQDSNSQTNSSANSGSSSSGGGSGVGGSSGSGSSSSSTSTLNSTSSPYCPKISYALRNFIKNSECLSSSNGICTNKNVYCSVTVENLDQNSGQFTIEITIYNTQTSVLVQQFQTSKTINSNEQVIFDKFLSFQSQTEDGDANKNYDCSFKTLEVPKKSDC